MASENIDTVETLLAYVQMVIAEAELFLMLQGAIVDQHRARYEVLLAAAREKEAETLERLAGLRAEAFVEPLQARRAFRLVK